MGHVGRYRRVRNGKEEEVSGYNRADGAATVADPSFIQGNSATLAANDPLGGASQTAYGLNDDEQNQLEGSYAEAAAWSSVALGENEGDDMESADDFELTEEAQQELSRQAIEGWNDMDDDLRNDLIKNGVDVVQWAHDYWLTREGHGAGFWDRGDDVYGPGNKERLTEFAKSQGEGGTFFRVGENMVDFDPSNR